MPKPVLILQLRPEDITADSEYACFLKYGQLSAEQTHRIRIEQDGIPADLTLDSYSAIIVGGSPFDISTPGEKKSALQKRIEADFELLLSKVLDRDFPFLGACSGNGLLGLHLGTPITTKYAEPVGCVTLDLTESGKQDKLLRGFPDHIDVLLGHKEACDHTPKGATLLMTGDACPVQMFRVGENVYAHHGYFEPHEAEVIKKAVSEKPTPWAQELLRRFVTCYL